MKKQLLITLLIITAALGATNLLSQGNSNNVFISSPANINPSSINTCQGQDTFRVRVLNINVSTLNGVEITYSLPVGLQYSSSFTTSAGFTVTEINVTDPQNPVLGITDLVPGDNPTIEIVTTSDCGTAGQVTLTNYIRVDISNNTTYDELTPGSYVPNNPSIVTTSDFGVLNAQFGQSYSRIFTLEESGNGFLREVYFERTVGSAYTVDSLILLGYGNVPFTVIPGAGGVDTIRLKFVDSLLVAAGLTDSTFDQGDQIRIREVVTIVDCDGNSGGQAVGYWGCGPDICEKVNPTSVGILFGAFAPDLIFEYYRGDDLGFYPPGKRHATSYNCDMSRNRAVLVRNIGNEVATGISFEIYAIDPQVNVLDTSGFRWRKGRNGTPMLFDSVKPVGAGTWNSPTEVSNIMFGGPVPRRYTVFLSSENIEVGDSLYVQWAEFNYANDWDAVPGIVCSNGSGGYLIGRTRFWNMTYSDPCKKVNVNEGFQGDQDYLRNRLDLGQGQTPVSIFAGTPATTSFTATAAYLDGYQAISSSLGAMDSSAYIDYKFTLPNGVDYAGDPTDSLDPAFELISSNGLVKWYPSEIIYNDPIFIARYYIASNPRPAGFGYTTNTQLNLTYDVDCAELPACPAPNPSSTIKKEIYAVLDTNCGKKYYLDCVEETNPFIIFCNFCDPCAVGIRFDSTSVERSSFGIPDNDNDGRADTTSTGMISPSDSLDLDNLVKDKYITGDSITGKYLGFNNTTVGSANDSVPFMEFCYGQLNVPFSNFEVGSGLIRIYNADAGIWHTGTTPKVFKLGNVAYLDGSVDSLIAYANMTPTLPPGFVYEQDDSVYMEIKIGVTRILGRTKQDDLFSMTIWDSDVAFPSTNRKFQCVPPSINLRRMTQYGFDDFKVTNRSWNVQGCTPRQAYDYYWIYMFETWLDQFPYEYRNLFDITQWEMAVPPGATLTTLRMDYYRQNPQGSNVRYIYLDQPFEFFAGGDSVRMTNILDTITNGRFGDIRSDGSVLMYVYPTWQLSCESPDNVSQSYGSDFDGQWNTNQFGTLPITTLGTSTPYRQNSGANRRFYFNYQAPKLKTNVGLQVVDAIQKTATWTVNFENNAPNNANAYNSWFYFDNTLSGGQIQVDSVKEISSGIVYMANANGFYELGNLNSLQSRQFEVFASYGNCSIEYIELYSGYNCPAYFTDINDVRLSGGGCQAEIDSLGVQPLDALLQATNTVGLDSSDLCDPHLLEYEFTNVQVGHSYNTTVRITTPLNAQVDTTNIVIEYPIGGTAFPVPSSAIQFNAPNEYLIFLDSVVTYTRENGLPGPLTSGQNNFKLSYNYELACGYVSGSQLKTDVYGLNSCGSNTNVAAAAPQTVFVFGVPEPYFINPRISSNDSVKICSNDITVRINSLKLGSNAIGPNDSLRLTLPSGLSYVPGSIVFLNNPLTNAVPTTTMIGSVTILEWNLPTPVAELDSIDFTIDIRVDSNVSCGVSNIQVQTISDASGTCGGSSCGVKAQTGNRVTGLKINKPFLNYTEIRANSIVADALNEEVSVYVSYTNIDTNRTSSYSISVYSDVNANTTYEPGIDTLVHNTGVINRVILFNDTVNDTITFTIPNSSACPLLLQFDSSSCMCEYDLISVDNVLLLNAGNDTAICTTLPIQIGGQNSIGHTYVWSGNMAGSSFDDVTISNPVYSSANVTSVIIDEVYLTTTRGSGAGCVSVDTILITVNPRPVVTMSDDTTICRGTSANLFVSGTGQSTYLWSTTQTDSLITVTPLSTTNYTIRVIDTNSCITDSSVEVTVLNSITGLFIDSVYPYCSNNGSIFAVGVNGGPHQYSITSATSGFQFSGSFTNLAPGSYTVYGRDLTYPQCVVQSSNIVTLLDTVPPLIIDTAYFTPERVCNGTNSKGSITTQVSQGQGTITYNLTGAFVASNTTGIFTNLSAGTYSVKATDSLDCPIDIILDFELPIFTCDTIITTDTVVCVDTTQITGGVDSITTCDGSGMSTGGGIVTIDPLTGCVTTSPDFGTGITDTTCIIVCDSVLGVLVCDTTIIITIKPPTIDTIVQLTNGMTTDSCITTSELPGTMFTYTSCGNPSYGTLTNLDSCYKYVPSTNALDTACTIICDENGICDTTIFIYVPPVTNDTVITTDTVVCVDTNNLPGASVDSITTCDGSSMSTGGGTVTIDPVTGCVTTSPDFGTGITDTTCIVVCKNVAGVVICDTTIIVTIKPPTIDTIVQLTNGMTTDSCITTSELPGTMFTYTSCGNPSYGTLTNLDSCYKYVPSTNALDTACTIICDENGICDTTIFIYVPPVTNDTVITTDTIVCVDTNDLLGASVDSITTCDGSGMSTGGGTVTIDPLTGCVTTSPDFGTGITDTTCIVVCKNVAGVVICDTTIIVTVKAPTPDTIVQMTNGGPVDSCLTQPELPGTMFTYTNCGNPINGTLTNSNDTCFNYTPINDVLDTACVIICDENGICDTTIFIYVPPVTNDTVITTDTVVCVDTNDLLGASVDSITTCDGSGMSTGGGTVTIDPLTGCVTTSPDFGTGITDTTCIVVCKNVAGVVICDTTIIVTVKAPTPDTIVQMTNGGPVDSCLTQNELPGTMFTYTNCGNPINGTLTNSNDTCFNYTPINDVLDTACIIICDENGICDTTIFIYVPPVTNDTVITTDTIVCVDTNDLLGASVDSITTCDGSGMSTGGGTVTIDPLTGCVTTSPDFGTGITDTTCIVVCKNVAGVVICDTTIIVTVKAPTPDTIVQMTNGGPVDSCLTQNELLGTMFTYTNCGNPINGTLTNSNDTCFNYTPINDVLDTACVIICDENGICDTTIFIYVPPVTNDTVITTDTVVCVDTNDLLGASVDSITTCDGSGMSTGGGTVTIDPLTGCVTTSPDFGTGITDTTCIVVCKNVAGVVICDTTIIVTIKPPTIDTIVQLTNGMTTDSCITTSELPGTMFTYTSCGNPSYGTLTNLDSCYKYVPSTNSLDTACTIICDENGICDTTIFIYVPPVTNDTVITTDTIVCVDTNDLLGASVDSITTCDGSGMSTGGGTVTIDPLTGCVTTSPDFGTGITDTTCIVVCKNVAGVVICDTTIIVTVKAPTPDTIVQMTNGGPVDSCLTQPELPGTMFTYTNCGNPINGTLTNSNDTCFNYTPINDVLDTACVIICDENGICDTTIFIYVPPVTPDTVITTDTIVCVDTNDLLGASVDSITTCDGSGMSTGGGTVTIDPLTGCVTTSPDFGTGITDTTCIVVCKNVAGVVICDTTIIVTVKAPTPDTIVQMTNGGPVDSCLTQNELPGTMFTYTNCGNPINGTLTNSNDTCFNYTPINDVLDTACIIICDENGICDTTIFIYVPPVTPDTVITTDTIVCVDTNDLLGASVDSITTCDGSGMSTGGGTVTIDPLTGCVTTSPDFGTGITDTTCIVVCKNVAGVVICDTTIIVTVKAPTPDTIIQLTNGGPVDSCLTQNELLGTMFTYTNCGNPINGTLTNSNDTCFNYTPINDVLDTACVIICDENGICDTTIFIYVPPVTPDTIYTLDTLVCVDTTEMPNGHHTVTGCDGMSPTTTSGGGTVTLDAQGCATISPIFTGKTDTTCIIICDTVFGICDTTLIINMRRAVPDTIIECIPRDGQANDSNMNTNDLLGDVATISVFKLASHGQFTLTNDTNSSYQTSPSPRLDTVQVSFCDAYGFCDTFTFIYIPPMTVDTIYSQGGLVCVDTTEMPRMAHTTVGTCDGTNLTSNGGTVVPMSNGCVTITPDFSVSKVDTTCIVLCDTILPMCECDTTYIISFEGAGIDTITIQLPRGTNTADTCLSTRELFGSTYTYRRLGGPTPHGPVTTHNDTCINYVQTSTTKYLDTARVLICDEYGNCDTTIIIYVPTPDPDTMYVGPVIPVTNVDTCVVLESSYMTGHHVGTCDSTGTSSAGVPVTITGLCVRYPVPSPVFTGDTVCIIVCDTIRDITICDTTLIVYLPDTTPPTVICKNDTVYLDNLGTVTIDTSNVLSSVTDNTLVNAVWLTPSTFNCANVGPNNVSVYARDTNRNMDSCQSIVTVLDTIPPTVICRNITIQLDSNGNASIVAMDIDGGSTDNCAIASMVINQTSFDCSHVGSNSVTLTVTDIYGNSSSCTSTVTVEDNIAPIAYCPGDKQRVIRNTNCSYIVEDFTSETSTWDNCSAGSGVTITQLPLAGTEVFLENASQLITITATDGSGNTSSCSFNVYARCVKELNIPQFISPDGSGQNDTWEIPELANYPNNTVKVFNRWGNLVMEEKGYSTGWNGSSNVDRGVNRLLDNKMLPEGTYFYIIDLGTNDIEPYVGYLQIKR